MTRDLTICAVLLGVLAISPVLFWRVMVDRVMYYGSMSTFTMLCIAFLVLLVFEAIFGHLRRYLVLFVTTRVDVKIWTHMFDKLLNLPIDFFERTPTGEILHDMYEIYRVRQFLTGQLFGTLLDSFVLVIFLPIMFMVSTIMTSVVLAICLLICVILVAMLPTVRRKVGTAVQAEVQRGTLLVESVHGIRAIKSLALDARQRHEFDVRVARVAETRFDEGLTSNLIQTLVHPLQTLMTNGVIAVAVYLALTNKDPMYLGAIFAFMIMTQRVTMPVIQAAQSIVQIDEARRALQGCARIINQPAEAGRSGRGIRTPLRRPHRIQRGDIQLSRRHHAGARSRLVQHPRGQRVRSGRPQRLGKDHRHPPAAGAAQRLHGLDQDRRQRSARDRPRSSALQPRRRAAGEFPVPRHDPRDDCRRQAARDLRGDRPGGAAGRRRRVHRALAGAATKPSSRKARPTCRAASASGSRSPAP